MLKFLANIEFGFSHDFNAKGLMMFWSNVIKWRMCIGIYAAFVHAFWQMYYVRTLLTEYSLSPALVKIELNCDLNDEYIELVNFDFLGTT